MSEIQQSQLHLEDSLTQFDQNWSTYEKLYIGELMAIECDARRFIVSAISYQKQVKSLELKFRSISSEESNQLTRDVNDTRSNLLSCFCRINSVANTQGKGRDDFDITILLKAESLLFQESTRKSTQAIFRLAKLVLETFESLRFLVRQYAHNIEIVDP